jgi:hypothetical protein
MVITRGDALLDVTGVVMMVVVMVMGMDYHHDLRLRRKGNRETEEENHTKEYLFHLPSVSRSFGMR